jgi:hypothetical protein
MARNPDVLSPASRRIAAHVVKDIDRGFGVRTATEINRERYALKYLRGDFRNAPPVGGSASNRACQALAAMRI